jgi:hypothetical protein
MTINDDDIYLIADHIAHSIDKFAERYMNYGSHLTFDDYVLTNVAVDLQWKYSRYQIQEAFEDRRIKLLLEFYITEENYQDDNTIH